MTVAFGAFFRGHAVELGFFSGFALGFLQRFDLERLNGGSNIANFVGAAKTRQLHVEIAIGQFEHAAGQAAHRAGNGEDRERRGADQQQ